MNETIKVGDHVLVSRSAELRELPERVPYWYNGRVVAITPRAKFTTYHCWIEFHANDSRPVNVRNNKPDQPTTEWDAIKPKVSHP